MLRCIIVDDEPLSLDLLEDNIKKVSQLQLVGRCHSAMEAMEVMHRSPIDLVFTDISMPGITGIQLIEGTRQKPMFIIITAYNQHALEGFNLDVVDYLLKPVSIERFLKATNKAIELHRLRQPVQLTDAKADKDYLFVNADYSNVKVNLNEVVLLEALKDYIKIVFSTNKPPLVTRCTMKSIEQLLPPTRFARIHKSYIVNIQFVTSVRKNSLIVNKLELPVSPAYKHIVDAIVNNQ
jgi:two-component system, LytTR family, response regulator